MNHHHCGVGLIWVDWNLNEINRIVGRLQEQLIHCQVNSQMDGIVSFLSIVYGDNDAIIRKRLWSSVVDLSCSLHHAPRAVPGDSNATRSSSELINALQAK
ncbi:hypothetical protein Nepgr_004818 [Nepenthes gracilis]|uniref:Uncharacterized protein n=1 Tax=Nepenthes gracilis TaxID=150966 RepID=A0AAD3S2K0_NEPGR|nr:hypothetical protein Nepgr_004818 [Nepenthes gracilis]